MIIMIPNQRTSVPIFFIATFPLLKAHYSLMGIFPSFGVALIDPTENVLPGGMDIC